MASPATSPPPQVFSPGLLFSHDWGQLHTPRAIMDTTMEETDSSGPYQTDTFPITNVVQFEAFRHGLGRCDVDARKNCPLQLLPGHESENAGGCSERPLSAIVKMMYKVTHKLSHAPGETSLSDDVIEKLQRLEFQATEKIPKDGVAQFFKTFGSHFPQGDQKLGKCFSWMVVAEDECNMDLLAEISDDIFAVCDKYEASIPGSHEGLWYSLHNVLDVTSWDEEKKKILLSTRLCVVHQGSNRNTVSLSQWDMNDCVDKPVRIDPVSENLVSVWHMIEQSRLKFQISKRLALLIKEEWKQLAEGIKHHGDPVPAKVNHINIPRVHWGNLLEDLEMNDYFPAKLTLQKARSLHVGRNDPVTKQDVPWNILRGMMFLNSMCRDEDIRKLSKGTKEMSFKDLLKSMKTMPAPDKRELLHPMDVTLLIFLCSDFMLRQVLAKKLFMCRLAIPFIVPTPEDTVEILLWPLRSIILEWCDKQGAKKETLVKSKVNIVSFMRFGQTTMSKSQMMNAILSPASHDTFHHRDSSCGGEKRQISNGTVEMSHFLPSASETDYFSQAALFFNLRGDACDYPVQHSLMMELATVLVILVDLQGLQTKKVQELLCDTVKSERKVLIILTDSACHAQDELHKLLRHFSDLLGDALKHIEIVNTFEHGKQRNTVEIIKEIRESITNMMVPDPQRSLETFASLTEKCDVDETSYHCKAGHEVAQSVLLKIQAMDVSEKKQTALPNQDEYLRECATLLRKLYSKDGNDAKEDIKKRLDDIKKTHASASESNNFVKKFVSMICGPEETRRFAIQWIKMELDAISLTVLPQLQRKKDEKCRELMKAKEDKKNSVPALGEEISALEKQIDAATFGLEHLMREMANMCDVALDLRQERECVSSVPDTIAHLLLEGQPVELMDGDHGFIPLLSLKAMFHCLAQRIDEKKIFVLSVIGIQGTAISCLFNTLFGMESAVSAGRCTRGIYAQLLPVATGSGLPFDYMLVLDAEGLRALEQGKDNCEHAKEMVTIAIGLSDQVLVSIGGEQEANHILNTVVLALLHLKLADSSNTKQCVFIHQDTLAINADEKAVQQKLQEQLDDMTQQASEEMHHNITSFNDIISQQDLVCFPAQWDGVPPMATVSKAYSTQAVNSQQRILSKVQIMKKFRTVSELVACTEDFWKGVLSDDFVLNFQSSSTAKAYHDLELEFVRVKMEIEEDLQAWINTTCQVQMRSCNTEQDVDNKCAELQGSLQEHITKLLADKQSELEEFFKAQPTSELYLQWRAEKKNSLQLFGEDEIRKTQAKLQNAKNVRKTKMKQEEMSQTKEQDIMRRSIDMAEKLRGEDCAKDDMEKRFDEMWTPWATELIKESSKPPPNVKGMCHTVLEEIMTAEGNQEIMKKELEEMEARDISEEITEEDVADRHVSMRTDEPICLVRSQAADQANGMMEAVMDSMEPIYQQDAEFDPQHGRQVLDCAVQEITKFNNQKHTTFCFTPEFQAMFGLHVTHHSTPKFEKMNQKFEEKHGMKTKLKHYREQVFKQFQNVVEDAPAEVMAADQVCEMVKGALLEYVKQEIDRQVMEELGNDLGTTKYDLITKMLGDIIDSKSLPDLLTYVNTPAKYAKEWVKVRGEKLIFGEDNGESRYKQIVRKIAEETIAKLHASAQTATKAVLDQESHQYDQWVTAFHEAMHGCFPLEILQIEITDSGINDFRYFETSLKENFKHFGRAIEDELSQDTADTVTWANGGSPFWRVNQRLWGCTEMCTLCSEPCQYSDPNHTTSHSCIQHRPSGVKGVMHVITELLSVTTCNEDVSSERSAFCDVWDFKCRNTPHCTGPLDSHQYSEYKKFLPDWDIAADPSGEATKFWQWAMCTFQDELVEKYGAEGVEIPDSWKKITEQEARDSLNVLST